MSYLKLWKRNAVTVVLLLVAAGTLVAIFSWAQHRQVKLGPDWNARAAQVRIKGYAPAGVRVVYSTGRRQRTRYVAVPFHAVFPIIFSRGDDPFAQIDVRPRKAGSITCFVRIGRTLSVGHSTGTNLCTAYLSWDLYAERWSGPR